MLTPVNISDESEIEVTNNPEHHSLLNEIYVRLNGYEVSEIDSAYIVGSHAHGTYVEPNEASGIDDIDITVIFVPNARHALGLGRVGSHQIQDAPYDITFHAVGKFVSMLLKSNPNALMMLFMSDNMIIKQGRAMQMLRDNREAFISQEMYGHFVGYAMSQITNMSKTEFKGYMGQKRKELVEKYGYDVKSAAHAIRVLYMGIYALNSGIVPPKLSPCKLGILKSVKAGKWTLHEVQEFAENLFIDIRDIDYAHLPEHPDRERAEDMLVQIQSEAIYGEVFREKFKGLDGAFIPRPHQYNAITDQRLIGRTEESTDTEVRKIAEDRNSLNIDMGDFENSPDVGGGEKSDDPGVGENPWTLAWGEKSIQMGGEPKIMVDGQGLKITLDIPGYEILPTIEGVNSVKIEAVKSEPITRGFRYGQGCVDEEGNWLTEHR